jgi:hypothetical protein
VHTTYRNYPANPRTGAKPNSKKKSCASLTTHNGVWVSRQDELDHEPTTPYDKTQQTTKTLLSQTIQTEQQIQHKAKLDKPRTNESKLHKAMQQGEDPATQWWSEPNKPANWISWEDGYRATGTKTRSRTTNSHCQWHKRTNLLSWTPTTTAKPENKEKHGGIE